MSKVSVVTVIRLSSESPQQQIANIVAHVGFPRIHCCKERVSSVFSISTLHVTERLKFYRPPCIPRSPPRRSTAIDLAFLDVGGLDWPVDLLCRRLDRLSRIFDRLTELNFENKKNIWKQRLSLDVLLFVALSLLSWCSRIVLMSYLICQIHCAVIQWQHYLKYISEVYSGAVLLWGREAIAPPAKP